VSEERNQKVNNFLHKFESIYKVIWLSEGICPDGTCNASVDDAFMYRDGGHLSHEGSALLGKKMKFYDLITEQKNPTTRHNNQER